MPINIFMHKQIKFIYALLIIVIIGGGITMGILREVGKIQIVDISNILFNIKIISIEEKLDKNKDGSYLEIEPEFFGNYKLSEQKFLEWEKTHMKFFTGNEEDLSFEEYKALTDYDRNLFDKMEMGESISPVVMAKRYAHPNFIKINNNKDGNNYLSDNNLITSSFIDYSRDNYIIFSYSLFPFTNGDVEIHNGNFKYLSKWKDYARLKKVRLYINDKPLAVLNLKDVDGYQKFVFPELKDIRNKCYEDMSSCDSLSWVFKFEILDIYKGEKYKEIIPISEILMMNNGG
jgi:hypothetical protein